VRPGAYSRDRRAFFRRGPNHGSATGNPAGLAAFRTTCLTRAGGGVDLPHAVRRRPRCDRSFFPCSSPPHLSLPPPGTFPRPRPRRWPANTAGIPRLQSLRRQLASAVLVAELKLTAEQKTALKSVLADARKTREELKSDAKIAAVRADRKVALKAAIDEVHSKGSLSEKTKDSLKEGGRDAMKDMGDVREKMKSFRESVVGILTPSRSTA